MELYERGRYTDAEPLVRGALALYQEALGPEHAEVATSLNNLAALYQAEGRYAEAEPLYQHSLAIDEKVFGPSHPEVAIDVNNLAALYRAQGRYEDAEPLLTRSLAIYEKALGPEHLNVAITLNNLAELDWAQGRYADAEPLYRRSLGIYEKALGLEAPDVAQSLGNLAELYRTWGRYAEAEPLLMRSLAIDEKALGPEHPKMAAALNNLAALYLSQGRYAEAEPLYKRSSDIFVKTFGPEHPNVARSLGNLAELYRTWGRYAEAEPLCKRSLALDEKTLGGEHPNVALDLNNLAELYWAQGRYAEAEPLYRRSLAIREKALGPEHADVAQSLNNLAALQRAQGRYAEAEPLFARSLAIREKVLGPEHPDVAQSLNNLADLERTRGRYAEAEPLFTQSLAIYEKTLGPEHSDVALSLNNLAELYLAQGRYAEAEPLFTRSLAIFEKALGPEHPNVATSLVNLAGLHQDQGRRQDALGEVRRATGILRNRVGRAETDRSASGVTEQRTNRNGFLLHVAVAEAVSGSAPDQRDALMAEAFEVGQLAQASDAARAMAGMTARFAATSDDLGAAVRERQDALAEWQSLDRALVAAASEPAGRRDPASEAALRQLLSAADGRIADLDGRLARDFPRFAEIANPRPVALAEAAALLGPDEALLVWAVREQDTFLWAVRRDRSALYRLPVGRQRLADAVTHLRAALDPSQVAILDPADLPPFDTEAAHQLYRMIVAPAEDLLAGARRVLVVPDGPLQSLPPGVLVTAEPQLPSAGFDGYRAVPWLARRYALTVLPAVSSLKGLRTVVLAARAERPFVGIGDPVLEGEPGTARGVQPSRLFRGATVDVDEVRTLPPLPDTAGELRAEARALGAGEADLYLRERATLPQVRAAGLKDFRILSFATHGLVAGDLKGLAEPALVLTPPARSSAEDDGLLTASRIAQLQLNADWVVLSACNTAAGDGTPGAEGLSGLAKAFFYAGSRAVLVSHWPVISEAAVKLTTSAFAALGKDPSLGRAGALQQAMVAVMADKEHPYFAHPMLWAPFVVVGEGGAGR